MKKFDLIVVLGLILVSLSAGSTAFAGSPAQPPGSPPYGMAVQGDVAGTKLTGVVEVSFYNLHCTSPGSFSCNNGGPDLSSAKATMRLSKGTNNVNTFYVDLGTVHFSDVAAVQTLAMERFRAPILAAFFGVPVGTFSPLQIYLKDISTLSMGNIVDNTAPAGNYISNPGYPDKIVEFSAVADLVVAVK